MDTGLLQQWNRRPGFCVVHDVRSCVGAPHVHITIVDAGLRKKMMGEGESVLID
ncbi:hypothetical protein HanRHA438_Chr16g0742211 [Helianthus annuus]|nr:hypothetical protein HanRHA438_Chr16g0742211 [Helianthus annuus]